jgi:hypothetical protein
MSWVAAEKPSSTAARAMWVRLLPPWAGSMAAMSRMAPAMASWATSSQARRRPSQRVSSGSGKRSMSGAQTNLKE